MISLLFEFQVKLSLYFSHSTDQFPIRSKRISCRKGLKSSIVFLVVFFLSGIGANTLPAQSLTLDDLLVSAEEMPEVLARMKEIEAALSEGKALPQWYRPDLYFEGGYGLAANDGDREAGPMARLVGQWRLWDGGRTRALQDLYGARAELSEINARISQVEIEIRIAEYYYSIVRLQEIRSIYEAQIRSYGQLRTAIRQLVNIGRAGRSDIIAIDIKRDLLREKINQAESEKLLLEGHLREFTGVSEDIAFRFPDDSTTRPVLEEQNIETFLPYRVALMEAEMTRASARSLETSLSRPEITLDLYGGYGPRHDALDTDRPEVGASIGIRLPLLLNRSRKYQLEAARLKSEAATLDVEAVRIHARRQGAEMRSAINRNRELLPVRKRNQERLQQNLNLSYTEFRRGQKAPADMVSAIDSYYAERMAVLDLEMRLSLQNFEYMRLFFNETE